MPPKTNADRIPVQDFAKRLPQAIEETRITLFVCGPAPSRRAGALLRRYISTEITKRVRGVTVVWGEHRDFRGIGKNIQLKKFSDVTKELHFAGKESDLTIIFPDSPGSFVELGIFGMKPGVCTSLLIVFDAQYRTQKSFVVGAMGQYARSQNAIVKFLSYRQRGAVLGAIEAIVRKKQEIKYNADA